MWLWSVRKRLSQNAVCSGSVAVFEVGKGVTNCDEYEAHVYTFIFMFFDYWDVVLHKTNVFPRILLRN